MAYLVGENGFVHGIDIGARTYGAPVTLGEAADYLMSSHLGNRLKMEYEIDLLSPEIDFPENSFDYIVLSHCSWYLKSFDELYEVLKKTKKWGSKLCFAEWDSRIQKIEQYPHLLSILIQAQYELFKRESDSNIRTLFTPSDIKSIVNKSGWNIMVENIVFSEDLQDGQWEVNKIKDEIEHELQKIKNMPPKLHSLIQSEVSILEEYVKSNEIKPLSVFSFIAE